MKKILLIIILFSTQFFQAQEQNLIRAKRYFDRTFYSEAIPLYEAAVQENQDLEVIKNLADAYYFINDMPNAQKWYRLMFAGFNDLDAVYYFRYLQTLKANSNYDEANTFYRNHLAKTNDTNGLIIFEKSLHELENISAIGPRFEIKNATINTAFSDFSAFVNKDSLVFASVKKSKVAIDKTYKWNNESYLDLYAISLSNLQAGDSVAVGFSDVINTNMHEANAVFTKDGKTIYFTRNNFKNGKRAKNSKKISNLQLYSATLKDGKWTDITSLPFNSPDYSTEHPALSADEQTLFFASDMPGTLGSFDIFSVAINQGAFAVPINLGSTVNTAQKEQFPFVSKDNKLYFSSNGHFGYGSLDVFVSEIKNDTFSRPLNVGLPVNSGYDDFSFVINSDTKEGYFSSNRLEGKGNDDIYSFKETKDLIIEDCKQFIAGIITDIDTQLPLDKVLVVLRDANSSEISRITTNQDGSFSFTVGCETNYTVLATKEKYSEASRFLQLKKIRYKKNDASMALKSEEAIKKEAQLREDKEKKEAQIAAAQKKKDAEVALVQQKTIADSKKKQRELDLLEKEKDVVKDKDRLLIKTDPIYFDYDLWYIRKESKPILNRVVELMKRYPAMVVEIGSHTDVRGNNKYNLDLSSKRAASTRAYFIENGIPVGRISSRGYGENVPILRCVPDDACSEEQHELNRRSEFVIKDL